MNWRRYPPLMRIFISFLIGILLVLSFQNLPAPPFWIFLLLLLLCLIFVVYQKIEFKYRFGWIFGLCVFLLFIVFGWWRTFDKIHFINDHHFSRIPGVIAYHGYIEEDLVEKSRSWKSVIQVQHVYNKDGWVSAEGKLLCYFSKDSLDVFLKNGLSILFYLHPDTISPSMNPYAFDYQSYLKRHEIGHRVYLSSGNWNVVEGHVPFSLLRVASIARNKLLNILEDSPLTASEFGVASAILLGYDDKLDAEQRLLYSNAGAAHILCVSGMHVGVIFIIFSSIFSFLNKTKKGKIARCFILLLLVWGYAFITGLAPAVSRASIMISFIIVAQAIGRKNNTWNAIVASALFLLFFNPFLLVDVGFQLSYGAVIAIVALQRPIYQLIQVPTWLGDKIWSLITVSLAAQLGTAPIAIWYFHQFPTWFLLTNLIVIPLSTVIIYTGMVLLCFSAVGFFKTYIGWLFFGEIRILNLAMEWVNKLPHAVVSSINMTSVELIFITVCIISGAVFFLNWKKWALFISLFSILIVCVSITYERIKHTYQTEFVIFENGRLPVMGFIHGRNMMVVTDSIFMKNSYYKSFTINPYIVQKGIKHLRFDVDPEASYFDEKTGMCRLKNAFMFNNDKMFVTEDMISKVDHVLSCDYLIVRNTYYGEPESFLELFPSSVVIVDGSNSWSMQQKWKNVQDSLLIPIYSLPERGAMVKLYND